MRSHFFFFAVLIIVVGVATAGFMAKNPDVRIIPLVLGILGFTFGSLLGLFLLGLFTRLAALPLIGVMAVAILTAKRADIHVVTDLLFVPEFLFIVLLLWLITEGAGRVSLDHLKEPS